MGNKHHDKYNAQRNTNSKSQPGMRRQAGAGQRPNQVRQESQSEDSGNTLMSQAAEIGETISTEMQSATTALRGATDKVSSMAATAASSAGHTLRQAGIATLEAVKANPIPLALTGVGLAWLAINAFGGPRSVAMPALTAVGSSSQKLGRLMHDAGSSAMAMEKSVETLLRENPLVIGAAVLAVGAAVGLVLPATMRENAWFGKGRDEIVHKAQELARDAVHKVESVAKQVTGATNGVARSSSRQAASI